MRLAPSTPITVRGTDGHPERERVLHQLDDDRIHYGWGDGFVLAGARGISWELGWDTEEAQAFAAQLLLQASG